MPNNMMETYHGYVRTPSDAIKLFEACRLGLLPRVQRRLSEKERQSIRSGSVFVWDEREAGMRRWTDGKSWSASRVSGSFLTYREMEGKRGGSYGVVRRNGKTPDSGRGSDEDRDDGEPDGYRYKIDGLMKQSFSITTSTAQHLHLISYYQRPMHGEPDLMQPTQDPVLRGVIPMKGMYPESSMNEAPVPALTRAPMQQQPPPPPPPSSYGPPPHQPSHPSHPQSYPPQYTQQGYGWPPSPVATPPYSTPSYSHSHGHGHSHYATAPPYPQGQLPPPPPPSQHHQSHHQHKHENPYPHHPQPQHPSPHHPSHSHPAPPPPHHQQQQQQHHHHQYSQSQPYSHAPPAPYERVTLPPPHSAPSAAPRLGAPAPHLHHYPPHHLPEPRGPAESPRSQHPPPHGKDAPSLDPRLSIPSGRETQGPLPMPRYSHSHHHTATPPPRGSVSPPHSGQSDLHSYSSNKASLSALLHHPTPTNSEPNSANPGSNSANSSPRALTGPGSFSSSTPIATAPPTRLAYGPTEDTRAIQSLNKKFRI